MYACMQGVAAGVRRGDIRDGSAKFATHHVPAAPKTVMPEGECSTRYGGVCVSASTAPSAHLWLPFIKWFYFSFVTRADLASRDIYIIYERHILLRT